MKYLIPFLFLPLFSSLLGQAPANDLCSNALPLPIANSFEERAYTRFSTVNATGSGIVQGQPVGDVWFSFSTGNYIPSRLVIDIQNYGYYEFYDSCTATIIFDGISHNHPSRDTLYRFNHIARNKTYYIRAYFLSFLPVEDSARIALYWETDISGKNHVFTPIGTARSSDFSIKNSFGSSVTLNGISSSNPLLVPSINVGTTIQADLPIPIQMLYTPNDMIDDHAIFTLNTSLGSWQVPAHGYVYGNGLLYDSIALSPRNCILYPNPSQNSALSYIGNAFNISHSGFNTIQSGYCGRPQRHMVVLPQITPRAGLSEVSFFASMNQRENSWLDPRIRSDTFNIWISTTTSDSLAFNQLIHVETLPYKGFHKITADLSQFINRPIYVGIVHTSYVALCFLKTYIDDFRFPDNLSSTEEPREAQVAILYPNPSSGTLTISLKEHTTPEDTKAKVIDIKGQVIAEYPFQSSPTLNLDLGHLPSGMYHIEVISPKASQTLKWAKVD